jgi:hypothetical protein
MIFISFGYVCIYGYIAAGVDQAFEKVDKRIKRKKINLKTITIPDDDEDVEAVLRESNTFFLGCIILLLVIGALVMSASEHWTYTDGLYWSFQTTSTVGEQEAQNKAREIKKQTKNKTEQ